MGIVLDNDQVKAASFDESSIVIAGPGSGKTRLLTEKAKAIKNSLALTFTRSAASEIHHRAPNIRASTIHSLCYHSVGKFRDYELLLEDFLKLQNKPRFEWILVDECQDLNLKELKVIRSIARKDTKVFFVGDTCQSIFGYQGALGGEIRDAVSDFFGSVKVHYLPNNYRSSSDIVGELEKIYYRRLVALGDGSIKGTAVFVRTNRQLMLISDALEELGFGDFQVWLRGNRFPGEKKVSGDSDIVLSNIHVAKGSEFRKVICFDWGESDVEKNLTYVALSRASEDFHYVSSVISLVEELKYGKVNKSS